MTNKKQRAVVICPGRGTYNKEELGYFYHHHPDKSALIETIDQYRLTQQQISISELDQLKSYSMRTHTAGENASALIYACAYADYLSIDKDKYDIVAVTGNSMGWYIALAVAQALTHENATKLINTMGSMMTNGVIGGQMFYPIVDSDWTLDPERENRILAAIVDINQDPTAELYISIKLGGYLVIAGNEQGMTRLQKTLPIIDDKYPMRLFNHAAFHSPLLQSISNKAMEILTDDLFSPPLLPMIDGLGNIWQPYSTDISKLHRYTLTTQVVDSYDFSRAIEVAIKEFAPEKLIILGPGATLGGAVAQCLIKHQWHGLSNKIEFVNKQKSDPLILSMGLSEQRKLVL